jgi:hypothetical protein
MMRVGWCEMRVALNLRGSRAIFVEEEKWQKGN